MQTIRAETYNNLRKGTIRRLLTLSCIESLNIDSIHTPDFSQSDPNDPIQDIADLDFWNVDYRFMTNVVVDEEDETFAGSGISILWPGSNNYTSTVSNLAANNASPNVWLASDSLAKSFYSTIMTDLGQTSATPNILLNAKLLQYFTLNFTYMQNLGLDAIPGPANDSYEALKYQTGPLNASAAIISTKYLCQVPRRKSMGTLFVSILVADLVFLQVLWTILKFCSVAWLNSRHPEGMYYLHLYMQTVNQLKLTMIANHCLGCAKQTSIALASLGSPVPEQHSRPPSEVAMGQPGTQYSRIGSRDEGEVMEDAYSVRPGI